MTAAVSCKTYPLPKEPTLDLPSPLFKQDLRVFINVSQEENGRLSLPFICAKTFEQLKALLNPSVRQ